MNTTLTGQPEPSPTSHEPVAFQQSNISMIREDVKKKKKKKKPLFDYYVVGSASLCGLLLGNVTPRMGKSILYLSLTSIITIPALVKLKFISVTEKGKEKLENLTNSLSDVDFDSHKKKGIDFVKKNFAATAVFTCAFLIGLNLYYKTKR